MARARIAKENVVDFYAFTLFVLFHSWPISISTSLVIDVSRTPLLSVTYTQFVGIFLAGIWFIVLPFAILPLFYAEKVTVTFCMSALALVSLTTRYGLSWWRW
jgi:hypothetical protein